MAKIVIECANPNDFAEIIETAERAAGNCTIAYAKQHLAMIESGKSKSRRESSRIIAAETGETPCSVEKKIERGEKRVRQPVAHDEQSNDQPEWSCKNCGGTFPMDRPYCDCPVKCKTPGCDNEARKKRTNGSWVRPSSKEFKLCDACRQRFDNHKKLAAADNQKNKKWFMPIVAPFRIEFTHRRYLQKKRTKTGVLKEMSAESGIPMKVLESWIKEN